MTNTEPLETSRMADRFFAACDEWGILAPVALAMVIAATIAIVGRLAEALA